MVTRNLGAGNRIGPKELDQYELRPEIAEPWDYTEVILREKYPDLPEDLFQTPQAAWIGQKMAGAG